MRIGSLPLVSASNASKSKVSPPNVSFGIVCPTMVACMMKRRMAILAANPSLSKTALDNLLLSCASKFNKIQMCGCKGLNEIQAYCCQILKRLAVNL